MIKNRLYYSSRKGNAKLSLPELYSKFQHIYQFFKKQDYFKQKAGITSDCIPDDIKHKAGFLLNFQPFPIAQWTRDQITEDCIFDVIEFLFDHISKPGELGLMCSDTGYTYTDYLDYNESKGKEEYINYINRTLSDYSDSYELSSEGYILAKVTYGLEYIIEAEIPHYDEENVDNKVRAAIKKWRNRDLDISIKKEAIKELADVFEWLRKSKKLSIALSKNDEKLLFNLANSFAIRHHNPDQCRNYDEDIWYSWMFHFYLASYHAAIRIIRKTELL